MYEHDGRRRVGSLPRFFWSDPLLRLVVPGTEQIRGLNGLMSHSYSINVLAGCDSRQKDAQRPSTIQLLRQEAT